MADEKKKKKTDDGDGLFKRIAKSGILGTRAKVTAEAETPGTIYERKKKEKK